MSKFTEEDIKRSHRTSAIQQAGWDKAQLVIEYYFLAIKCLLAEKPFDVEKEYVMANA